MSGGKSSTSVQKYDGIQIQSALLGTAIPRGWGTFMTGANILWYGNFQSKAQKASGGKGGGGTTTGYSYSASLVLGICKGPIIGVRNVYKDSTVYTPGSQTALQQVGLSLFTGAIGQADWTYLDTNFASQAIGYSGVAYVAASNYALDSSAAPPNHSFEVQSSIRAVIGGVTNDDANPADILTDFLPTVPFWSSSWTGSLSTWSTYCLAQGILLSPVLDSQRQASDFVTEMMTATNSNCFFSDGTWQVQPYGDTAITNNGVTYTPNLTPIYAFGLSDFIPGAPGDDPVQVNIKRTADAFNYVQVEYLDRQNSYRTNIQPATDAANVAEYGPRPNASPTALHGICVPAIAATVAQLLVQRSCNVRKTYKFRVGLHFGVLNCMDLVTLTTNYMTNQLVRITEMDDSSGDLEITAEEVPVGTAFSPQLARQALAGYQPAFQAAPGNVNAPVMFLPPLAMTGGAYEVCMAAAGGANWGGCEVWVSYDNATYSQAGVISAPARYGVTTTALPAGSNPDTAHTVTVDLTNSGGTLVSASATDAANQATLSLLGTELISFQSATLVSANVYTLGTSIWRGLQGSTIAAQASGSNFVRLDGAIFTFPFRSDQIGQTIYVKFLSYNQFGQALQALSDVSPYNFTLAANTGVFQYVNWTELAGMPANLAVLAGTEVIQNSLLPSGTGNRVILSQAEKGTIGWQLGSYSASSPGIAQQTYSGLTGIQCAFTAAASGQYADTIGATAYRFAVTAYESLACSALFNTTSLATASFNIEYYNSSGSFLSDASIGASVPVTSTLALREAILTVPAGAVSAAVWFSTTATGAGVAGAAMYQPMVQGVPAGQTTYPAFTPGPISTPGADVTSANTALYLNGQSAWATYSGLSPSNVAAPGNNLVYDGGFTLQGQGWALSSFTYQTFADIGPGFYSQISSAYMISPQFAAYAGNYYTAQLWVSSNSTASGTLPYIYIQWYTSGGGLNGNTPVAPVSNTVYALAVSTGAAPAGTAYGKFVLCTSTLSSGAYVWFCKAKVEQGSAATPFNDAATFGALYQSGATIDSLKPAQVNSDQTSLNTALYLNNSSPLAQGNSLTTGQVTNTNITVSGGTISGIGTGAGTYIDNAYVSQTTNTFQATQTFQGSQTALAAYLYNAGELVYLNGSTGWGSTATVILSYGSVLFMTSQTNANFVVNVEMGPSGQTVNAAMGVGEAVTIAVLVVNGATAYYCTGLHIDGTNYTVNWAGGSAPSAGFANGIDCYMFTIIKVSTTPTYTILGSLTQY